MSSLRNHSRTTICSVNKMISELKKKGQSQPKALSLLRTINETLNNVEDQINTSTVKRMNELYTSISLRHKSICGHVPITPVKYGFDNCLSPVFIPVRVNQRPHIDNPEQIVIDGA